MPAVIEAIEHHDWLRLERAKHESGVNLAPVLVSLARTAFADPRKLFDSAGQPLPVQELDDDTALAIESIEVVETFAGAGEERVHTGYVKKYKFSKRSAAQDMLMKHLNGYAADNKGKGDAAVSALTSLLEGMKRSALPVAHEVEDERGV